MLQLGTTILLEGALGRGQRGCIGLHYWGGCRDAQAVDRMALFLVQGLRHVESLGVSELLQGRHVNYLVRAGAIWWSLMDFVGRLGHLAKLETLFPFGCEGLRLPSCLADGLLWIPRNGSVRVGLVNGAWGLIWLRRLVLLQWHLLIQLD